MKKKFVLSLLIGFFIITNPIAGLAQSNSITEDELISSAGKLFFSNSYKDAMPLYAHLVSVYPDNVDFNFRYGVCALYSMRDDKDISIKYLSVAENRNYNNPELNYYLGLAYHYDQDYAKALKYYNSYLNGTSGNLQRKEEVLKSVNSCLNGLSLSGKNLIEEIINKTTFEKDNFHRGYYADDLNGTLIVKPEIFKSNIDKEREALTFVYLSEPQGTCYFSSYGQEENGNRDIYKSVLQENDEWSEPEKLSSTINTTYDEDYPVLVDNGMTLYFCSKGHNSLGGYDVFVSRYDKEKKVWGEPENLGVGINSPFDDILFIPDKNGETAFFASDRDNSDNTITVFNVKLNTGESEKAIALTEVLPQENLQGEVATKESETQKPKLIAQYSSESEGISVLNQASTPSVQYLLKEKLLNERNEARLMTDSAFLFVANTKKDIRKLTNARDRAKRVSDIKKAKAGDVNLSLDSLMKEIDNIKDIEIVKAELEKAKNLKLEYCSFMAASTGAYQIAEKLTTQIQKKEIELNDLKQFASQIQLKSVSGDIDSAGTLFSEAKVQIARTEIPSDFSKDIMLITSGKMEYDIPEKELAFANQYLKRRDERTYLAKSETTLQDINSRDIKVINKTTVAANAPLSVDRDRMVVPALIIPININDLALANVEPDNENIKIDFAVDVKPVYQTEIIDTEDIAFNEPIIEDDIEINVENDATSAIPIEKISIEKQAIAENTTGIAQETDFTNKPAQSLTDGRMNNDGLTYLTNSFILPKEIETSKTDTKLLELAINDPNELSYEELLYAAQLASNPSKSLKILDYAFVNEGRDWRAYNNAAAYAIELKDYNRAKVYLKQALMITDDNGMIENNIGIIAYNTGAFESAKKHFLAAENLGENSKHNLMVLKYVVNQNDQEYNSKIETTVETDDLIGDIIDYFPTDE